MLPETCKQSMCVYCSLNVVFSTLSPSLCLSSLFLYLALSLPPFRHISLSHSLIFCLSFSLFPSLYISLFSLFISLSLSLYLCLSPSLFLSLPLLSLSLSPIHYIFIYIYINSFIYFSSLFLYSLVFVKTYMRVGSYRMTSRGLILHLSLSRRMGVLS